jgi:hypothetical protein
MRSSIMYYQFLCHLTQATFLVVIYHPGLISQMSDYKAVGLLVLSESNPYTESSFHNSAKALKLTAAGRQLVRRQLRTMHVACVLH